MIATLKLEEAAQFIIATLLFYKMEYAWWVFPVVILLPDLSMIGYLINTKWGAILYNFFHHKALAIFIFILASYLSDNTLKAIALVLYAHSSMDRIFGYGLKFPDSFKNTHLGIIGK